jgi:hypothetical protein
MAGGGYFEFFIKHLFVEKREKYLKNLNCRDC